MHHIHSQTKEEKQTVVKDIFNLVNSFEHVSISFVLREGNVSAHFVAHQ